jgi:hypothetical protein
MKKNLFLILSLSLLLISKSFGQASIGISPYSTAIGNDTLPAGSSDSISFWVVNTGSNPFNDYIYFVTYVQDSSGVFYHVVDSTAISFPSVIAVGDSLPFSLTPVYDVVTPGKYHYDINIIVIWPVAGSASTSNVFTYVQVLTLPNGINEIDLSRLINAYPNPVTSKLTLKNSGKTGIEEVRIYDVHGRLIESLKATEFICTENWNPGVYMINILLENKQTHTIRVIKQ